MPVPAPDEQEAQTQVKIDKKNHRFSAARFVPSVNVDDRPAGMSPELIVIHSISVPESDFSGPGISQLFTNSLDPAAHPTFVLLARMRVSAHLLIRRDGEVIQYVPFHRRAWHAGESHYRGRAGCNDFSVGIELEGTDRQPFEGVQYQMLAEVTVALLECYETLSKERIVGHKDIAPGRKTDPGSFFEWDFLDRFADIRVAT